MGWQDWAVTAIGAYYLGDFVLWLVRRRRADREFRAWLQDMRSRHRGLH